MYHYVRDLKNSRYPQIKGLDLDLFRQQIDFFEKNFNVVTIEDVMKYYALPEEERASSRILPERALLLTFDDGYIDHYLNAFPILKEHGMQGSFFIPGKTFTEHKLLDVNKIHFVLAVSEERGEQGLAELVKDVRQKIDDYREPTGGHSYPETDELYAQYAVANRFDPAEVIFVKRMLQTVLPEDIRSRIASELFEKYVGMPENVFARELYMNVDQLRVMKQNGMYIGYHGYDHYWMNRLYEVSPEKLEKDVDSALGALSEFIDKENWICNYPYGSYSDDVINLISSKGCKLGFATDVDVVKEDTDPYKLPRLDCNDFPPKSENFKKWLVG